MYVTKSKLYRFFQEKSYEYNHLKKHNPEVQPALQMTGARSSTPTFYYQIFKHNTSIDREIF